VWDAKKIGPRTKFGATVLRLGAEESVVWDAGKLGPGEFANPSRGNGFRGRVFIFWRCSQIVNVGKK